MSQQPTTNKALAAAMNDPVQSTLVRRDILESKELLRDWYGKLYAFVGENLAAGSKHVEIGSGSSFLYRKITGLIQANIMPVPGNHLAFNAYAIPFADNALDNLVLIDVLHHFDQPQRFFQEAHRVLRPGGRVILTDPCITPFSLLLWKYLHPEGCDTSRVGFGIPGVPDPLLDANSASATLLFFKRCFDDADTGFTVTHRSRHTKFEYWLAGGYNFPHLFPPMLKVTLPMLEKGLSFLDPLMASFLNVVLEKGKRDV